MKILIVSARYFPEPFTITRIAEELAQRGHSVTVLTGRPWYGKWSIYPGYENVSKEIINGVNIIRVKEKARKKGMFGTICNYFSILCKYKHALRKMDNDYDVVLSHVMSPIFSISHLKNYCKKNGLKHVHYGFDLWPESLIATGYLKRSSILFLLLKKYCKKIYSGCDAITYASPSCLHYYRDYLGINCYYSHIFQPCLSSIPNIAKVKNHSYKSDGKLRILFCGTLAKFCHLDIIIKALSKYEKKENIVLDIVGSGSEEDKLKCLVKKYNLSKNVIFHGRVDVRKTQEYYDECDVLFVSLFYNSYTSLMIPQKLIEYLAYNRPIFGMIKGDGEKIIRNSSILNVVADQTPESLLEGFRILEKYSDDELIKCGNDNRIYFDSNKRFQLGEVCSELESVLYMYSKGAKSK